ncbi:MAG: Uma2 family endonuclease [Scytonema sp. PMC 1070.18]|nr:Uma2 family endonuclease [Scytonema sp. PMC 1070.18]
MTTLLPHRWTIEDYHRIVATGVLAEYHCELIRGEIIDMPPEGPEHAHRCETAGRYLERLFGTGWWARQGKPITLLNSEPEPDIAIVREQDYSSRHPTPEDISLIVEYSFSTQAKDTGVKRDIYAEADIPNYIVVDLKNAKVIHYCNPVNGKYTSEQSCDYGFIEVAGLQIDVRRLLPLRSE